MVLRRAVQLGLAVALSVAAAACADGTSGTRQARADAGMPAAVQVDVVNGLAPATLTLPNKPMSVKFAVIGDSGRGTSPQLEVAAQMARYYETFAFPFVIMLGDNLYEGVATPDDYRRKFEEPYAPLLKMGVRFYAVLGNHDDPKEVNYEQFNMKGRRYYRFSPPGNLLATITTPVEFFAIDSNYLDRPQLEWLDDRLANSTADWKICFLHHPIYTSGRYRASAFVHRSALESVFVKHGVDAVFSGHEHIYQRSALQQGIQYFVSGGAGSLRAGDGRATATIARSYSRDYHFMLVEIDGDELHFQAISRRGQTIDAGTLSRQGRAATPSQQVTRADTAALR